MAMAREVINLLGRFNVFGATRRKRRAGGGGPTSASSSQQAGGGGEQAADAARAGPAPPASRAAAASAPQRLPPPVKSPRDYNEYRVIRLENGLTALLISGAELSAETPTYVPDPPIPGEEEAAAAHRCRRGSVGGEQAQQTTTDEEDDAEEREGEAADGASKGSSRSQDGVMVIESVAACGLCVGVGSFSDPDEFQGLAHLLEHMVFMGSERFPRENEFDVFLNKHGGETNASTDSETTTFYFDCQYQHLFRALERFAQFFISPLIKRHALARELEALDSEFQSVLHSDSCRRQQLFSQAARRHHPATQFLWGNIQSLRGRASEERLYRLVHEFRRRHYSAHRMTLAVKAPIRLDVLESRVAQYFSQVPSNFLPPLDFGRTAPPFDTPAFRRLYSIFPVKDTCQVDLTWALPPCQHRYRSKPHDLAAWVLGHEGRGSLISYLRRRLWALDVYTGNWDGGFEMNSLYSMFSIHLTLTDEGARHVPQVIEAVFGYINLLRASAADRGPDSAQERLFREVQAIENVDFLFGEEESAADWVEMLSINMHVYPPQEYITGPKLYVEFDAQAVQDFVDQLRPDVVNIMYMSKKGLGDAAFDRVEPWFRTPYSVRDIPAAWLDSWRAARPGNRFALPEPNRFLTTDFTSLPLPPNGKSAAKYPARILHDGVLEVWYRRDDAFQLPVAFLYFQLVSPLPIKSLRNAVLLDLLVTVLKQQLVEELYPAEMALLNYCVYSNEKGLVVRVEGFSQKLPLVLDAIFLQLSRVADRVDGALFAAMQESLRRLYHNTFVNPTKMSNELRMALLLQVYWTPVDKYGVIEQTTLGQLKAFAKEFMQRLYIQCLVQGNVSMDGALAICRKVSGTLQCRPLREFPSLAVCQVPLGERCCRVRTFNPDDKNCSTVNYYQCGRATVVKCCMSELLVQLLDEPVFNALRTREQLGYDVTCQRRTTYNTLGFLITVNSQADKHTMDHVDGRIEAFLRDFGHALKTQCTRRFKFVKRTLRDEKECVDFDLQDEVSRNWKEITSNTYMFDRAERERQCLKNIRLKDLRKWFLAHLGQDTRRKLSVQVVGNRDGGGGGAAADLALDAAAAPAAPGPAGGGGIRGRLSFRSSSGGGAAAAASQRKSRPARGSPESPGAQDPGFSLRYVRASDARPPTYFLTDVSAYKKATSIIHSPGYCQAAAEPGPSHPAAEDSPGPSDQPS